MSDDGTTKDDVKIPDGECGDKIKKLFTDDGKDTSKSRTDTWRQARSNLQQTLLFSQPWARRSLLTARKLPNKCTAFLRRASGTGLSGTFTWLWQFCLDKVTLLDGVHYPCTPGSVAILTVATQCLNFSFKMGLVVTW
jgi:hypothetical protein